MSNKRFADLVEQGCERENSTAARLDLAYVFKVPDPVKITKRHKGGGVTGRLEPSVWVDYSGVWKDGRAIAYECKKSEHATRFAFSNLEAQKPGQVTQWERLARVHEMGGIAFVFLWWYQPLGGNARRLRRFVLPFGYLEQIREKRQSLPLPDDRPFDIYQNERWFDVVEWLIRETSWFE